MKIFDKYIGVPEALIIDGSKAKTSKQVKIFCINIGTTIKILEQGTPWANITDLCIVPLNIACQKI